MSGARNGMLRVATDADGRAMFWIMRDPVRYALFGAPPMAAPTAAVQRDVHTVFRAQDGERGAIMPRDHGLLIDTAASGGASN